MVRGEDVLVMGRSLGEEVFGSGVAVETLVCAHAKL